MSYILDIKNNTSDVFKTLKQANTYLSNFLDNFDPKEIKNAKEETLGLLAKIEELEDSFITSFIGTSIDSKSKAEELLAYNRIQYFLYSIARYTKNFLTVTLNDLLEFRNSKKIMEQTKHIYKSLVQSMNLVEQIFSLTERFEMEKAHRSVVIEVKKSNDIFMLLEYDIINDNNIDYEQRLKVISAIKEIMSTLGKLQDIANIQLFNKNSVEFEN